MKTHFYNLFSQPYTYLNNTFLLIWSTAKSSAHPAATVLEPPKKVAYLNNALSNYHTILKFTNKELDISLLLVGH